MNNKKRHSNLGNNKYFITRFIAVFLLPLLFLSCMSRTKLQPLALSSLNESWCPSDGVCTFEVLSQKQLDLEKDEFGMSYIKMDEGAHTILKFEYKRKVTSDVADASYREEIFIVLNPNEIEIETESFKRVQVIFGRWCFCKGQVGNYRVRKGKLSIKKVNSENYHLSLTFEVDEVPNIISKINHIFSVAGD